MSNVDLTGPITNGRAVFNRFLQQSCVLNPATQVSAGLGEIREVVGTSLTPTPCNYLGGTKTPEKYADRAGGRIQSVVVVPYGTVVDLNYHVDVYARGTTPGVDPPTNRLLVIAVDEQGTTFGIATSLVCVERT